MGTHNITADSTLVCLCIFPIVSTSHNIVCAYYNIYDVGVCECVFSQYIHSNLRSLKCLATG